MTQSNFNKLVYKTLGFYDKWSETIRELREVEIYQNSLRAFAKFINDKGIVYNTYVDLLNWKFNCDCDYYLKRGRICKHCKVASLFLISKLNIDIVHLKNAHFTMKIIDNNKVREYEIIKGKVIMRNFEKRQ